MSMAAIASNGAAAAAAVAVVAGETEGDEMRLVGEPAQSGPFLSAALRFQVGHDATTSRRRDFHDSSPVLSWATDFM